MTTLSIGRLTATVPRLPGEPDLGRQVEVMLADTTGRPLDQALEARRLPAGHWFLQRLDLRLTLDLRRAGPGTEQQWADAVALALHGALLSGQAVHYGSDCDALADLVGSAAMGRFDNEWAWRELGLVDGAISGPAGRVVLIACGRHPEYALAATITAIRRAGAGAVHRMLGSSGWLELARLVYGAHVGRPAPAWLAATADAAGPGTATAGATARAGPEPAGPGAPASEMAGRIARIAAGELARCFRHARLRPDPAARLAWAVLAAAETEPGLLMLPGAESAVWQLAAALLPGDLPLAQTRDRVDRPTPVSTSAPAIGGAAADGVVADRAIDVAGAGHRGIGGGHDATDAVSGRPGPRAASPVTDVTPTSGALSPDRKANVDRTGTRRGGVHADPTDERGACDEPGRSDGRGPSDDPQLGWPSEWAGLLHLYRTAAEADVPAAVLADDALSTRPLAWVLHSIAGSLVPAEPDDPALLTFAGLLPTDEPPSLAWRPADQPERDSIAGHAHRWLSATAYRLAGDGDGTAPTVERLLHRPGTIFAERGWIDIEMPLGSVDIDIRRAGLDIDPGWIGWLGSVVKFRYV